MTESENAVFWVCMSALAILVNFWPKPARGLDRPLLWWTRRDAFRVRDLLNGGLLILGITGSGKSSSSGKKIARAIVADRNSYGLVLAAKPEDLPMWQEIFRKTGQSKRLLVFDGAKSRLRLNFLEEAARHGDAREITKVITTIGETLASGDRGRGGENAAFFLAQQERAIHHAVELLLAAHGKVTSNDLQQFIATAATSRQQISQEDWRTQFHNKCIQAAHAARLSPRKRHDIQQATDFWCGEWSGMADRMRSSILAGVMGTLFVFNNGLVHELVSTTSNFTFEQLRRKRQWLLVNMAPSEYGDSGRFVGAGFKYLMQRHVLRMTAGAKDPFHICWCDEAQNWTNQFDAEYLAQCRSHRGCMVFLTQSVHSFHTAMRSEDSKHQTLSLLGNFSHRVFHALGDIETAQWASETLGRRIETHFGGSTQPAESVFDEFFGVDRTTSSFSEQYAPVLQPNEFMNGLRTGGPGNGYQCDAIIIRPGMPFSNGENFLFTTFSQR
ncbi:type IV secretory system conjugative DNA transfer family protein [bacterium]|nr:type IV secretory system conjugative DNA transfer family protein [bacterium]